MHDLGSSKPNLKRWVVISWDCAVLYVKEAHIVIAIRPPIFFSCPSPKEMQANENRPRAERHRKGGG
jgi:hypothetical protein